MTGYLVSYQQRGPQLTSDAVDVAPADSWTIGSVASQAGAIIARSIQSGAVVLLDQPIDLTDDFLVRRAAGRCGLFENDLAQAR